MVRSIDVSRFGMPVDAEGVEYGTKSDDVFIVDGVGREVWRVKPGRDGTFGNRDDVIRHFDVERFGAGDPEGIGRVAFGGHLVVIDDDSESIFEVTRRGRTPPREAVYDRALPHLVGASNDRVGQWSPPWRAGLAAGKRRTPNFSTVTREIFNGGDGSAETHCC